MIYYTLKDTGGEEIVGSKHKGIAETCDSYENMNISPLCLSFLPTGKMFLDCRVCYEQRNCVHYNFLCHWGVPQAWSLPKVDTAPFPFYLYIHSRIVPYVLLSL